MKISRISCWIATLIWLTCLLCLSTIKVTANDDRYPSTSISTNSTFHQWILPDIPLLPIRSPTVVLMSLFDHDPIRFTLQANKDSVLVGEEIILSVTADLLPISSSMLFFFEEQRSFSLKMLLPEGFQQTGGTYRDGISDKLTAEGRHHVEYTIHGYFTDIKSLELDFTLLRGTENHGANRMYQRKASLRLYAKKNPFQTISQKVGVSAQSSIQNNRNSVSRQNLVTQSALILVAPTYDCNTGNFGFNTVGGDGSDIEYMAPGITIWTKQRTGFIVQPGCDALPLILFARQSGVIVSYTWNWITFCQSVNAPPAHNPSISTIEQVSAISGQPFSYTFPSGIFEDPEDQSLIFSISGLPIGLTFSPIEGIISGTPQAEGFFTLNYKATDNVCNTVAISLTLVVAACLPPDSPALASSQSTICPGQHVTLTASNCPSGTIHWSTGTTGNIVTISATGFYWAKCVQNGCESKSQLVYIGASPVCCSQQPVAPQLVASQNIICPGQGVTLIATDCPAGTVIWSTGDTGNTLVISASGNYSAICMSNGCQSEMASIYIAEGVDCLTIPTLVRVYTRSNPGYNLMYRYIGSYFQGSNDEGPPESKNWQTLATILTEPVQNEWNAYSFSHNTIPYRYLRFVAGPESYGELMEIEFYSGNKKLPNDRKFGSESVYNNQASYSYTNAFDDNTTTMWHGAAPGNSNFVGIAIDGDLANYPTSNTAITLPTLTILAGTGLTYTLPSNAFISPKGQSLTYSASGLPNKLAINGLTINGVASTVGTYTVTVKATNSIGLTTARTLIIMVTDSAAPFLVLAPSYNCKTGDFYFNATGGDGSAVTFRAVGVTGWTTTSGPFTVLPFADAQPFTLQVKQNDAEYLYIWDWKAACRNSQ